MSPGNDKPRYSPAHPSYRHPVYGNLPKPCELHQSKLADGAPADRGLQQFQPGQQKAPGRTRAAWSIALIAGRVAGETDFSAGKRLFPTFPRGPTALGIVEQIKAMYDRGGEYPSRDEEHPSQ